MCDVIYGCNLIYVRYLLLLQLAFKTPIPVPIAPAASPTVAAAAAPVPVAIPDDATKQQMVQAMSQQSGMNFEYSTK